MGHRSDLLDYLELGLAVQVDGIPVDNSNQEQMDRARQTEKGLDSEKTEMAGKPPCKGQGKKNGYNGYLEKRRQDIEI